MMKDNIVEPVCWSENENLGKGMNERRRHRRFNIEHLEVNCDMPSASRVKVMG
jgi:hypothetical protein